MNRRIITLSAKEGYLNILEEHFRGKTYILLNSNDWAEEFDQIIGADTIDELPLSHENPFEELKNYHALHKDWLFGYFSYDLKNSLENLKSENEDNLDFPEIHFFRPVFLILIKQGEIQIHFHDTQENIIKAKELLKVLEEKQQKNQPLKDSPVKDICQKINKKEYIDKVLGIKKHIQKGDIYEMNFCQEFFANNVEIQTFELYSRLNNISPMPFSCYMHHKDKYLLCASPERYLKKKSNMIISQPIKGTIKRGENEQEDLLLINQLKESQKEQSENVMIVDLVRNDLSKTATRGSVKVDELFAVKTFKQVHQMVSTISSELKPELSFSEAIKTTFPMGSMTGAPKIRAMEIIEDFETTKRGLFSGAVGYISPEGDFDFNVVIRSILYNAVNKYLSFMIGGAITIHADPEKEYEECMLKAKAIFAALNYKEL
ncbi:MAG: anthranilate synthase component I family protein [Bacteroidota bacterium]|nr:anthranilate synthase component I family protein [Bacteroidota bacterium]